MNLKNFRSIVKQQTKKLQEQLRLQPSADVVKTKIKKFTDRLLKIHLKRCFKPILVIYFTPKTQLEIHRNGNLFLRKIEQQVGNKFYILVLPAATDSEVRAELWQKGTKLTKFEKQLFEQNIWVFNELKNLFG